MFLVKTPVDLQPLDEYYSKPFSCSLLFFCSGSRSVVVAQLNITSLGLYSLKEISGGDVVITKNQNLCYTRESHWKRLFKSEGQSATVEGNADAATCGEWSFFSKSIFCCFVLQLISQISIMNSNFKFR